jgi:hypothetical protein
MPHIKKSLDTFFRTYPAFLSHLQNNSHSNAKAEGLAKMMMELNTGICCFDSGVFIISWELLIIKSHYFIIDSGLHSQFKLFRESGFQREAPTMSR